MDITEIKHRLADSAEAVAKHLLPDGRREGSEWRAGSTNGEQGKSLGVHLSGQKAGIWQDFATSEGGDLIDLWMKCRSVSLRDALEDIRGFLGVSEPEFTKGHSASFKTPSRPKCKKPKTKVKAYLNEQRLISDYAIEIYKAGEDGNKIIFPYIDPDGDLTMAKWRNIDTRETMPTEAGCKPTLFGWQAIPEDAREVTICEGEIDALTLWDYGFPALSVPFGGGKDGKQRWLDYEYENLERFETVYLCFDDDKPGHEAANYLAERIGLHRCRIVKLPENDANKCRTEEISQSEIAQCFEESRYINPHELKFANEFRDEVYDSFYPSPDAPLGYTLPFNKIVDKLHFRPYEVSCWTGENGSGKSQILGYGSVHWVHEGATVCIASLEMRPKMTLKRMVKQAGNVDRPTENFLDRVFGWFGEKILIFDLVGSERLDKILEVFEYARKRHGADVFIIDSFMRLGIAKDDYTGQADAICKICDWVEQRPVHLHLVAHSSGKGESKIPNNNDIRGAGELGDNAFNIISIWRNRALEDEKTKARETNDTALLEAVGDKPSVWLNVSKQRNGDWDGKLGLTFSRETYRYENARGDGIRYIKENPQPEPGA